MARRARQLHIRQEPPDASFEEAVRAFAAVSELLARAEAREAQQLARQHTTSLLQSQPIEDRQTA